MIDDKLPLPQRNTEETSEAAAWGARMGTYSIEGGNQTGEIVGPMPDRNNLTVVK